MSSLSLVCPLCCNETFSSHNALKQHLLTIKDKLICAVCKLKFQSISTLAEHIGKSCQDATNCKLIKSEECPDQIGIKKEIEEDNEEIEDPLEANEDDADDDQGESSELLYTCQMCEISFNSVEEHLEKYHQGEEVFLETDENETLEIDNDGTVQNSDQENDDSECIYIYNDGESVADDNSSTVGESVHTEMEPSEVEEHIFDKNGQKYARKVVKIDKFWEKPAPMTEKYVIEKGRIRQISEDEAKTTTREIVEIHKCPNCGLQFPKKEHYLKHICSPKKSKAYSKDATKDGKDPKSKKEQRMKYVCHYCRQDFGNVEELGQHLKNHVHDDSEPGRRKIVTLGPHTCHICNTTFPTYKSLRLHERMHDPIKLKQINCPPSGTFVCEICNTPYDKVYEEIHMASHIDKEDFMCPTCNKKFFTKENLEMHMKAHSNGKKFSCSYCKKAFTNQAALHSHIQNECKVRQYECQYCGRKFSRPHEKVKHERIHTGEKPHVCQLCGKAFRVSYCLTLHLRTHTGTRPYECAACGKRFKSHGVYNHHMQTHSEVRRYKCPYCPKAFKTSVQLAGHRNSHTKPFACTECNRPFASLYAVRAHMETHRRDNNLKHDCWLCGATYARQFALRDHMRTQHSAQLVEQQVVRIEGEEGEEEEEVEGREGEAAQAEEHGMEEYAVAVEGEEEEDGGVQMEVGDAETEYRTDARQGYQEQTGEETEEKGDNDSREDRDEVSPPVARGEVDGESSQGQPDGEQQQDETSEAPE